jgi:hypothetical protein
MHFFKSSGYVRALSSFALVIGLSACEREVYTTWNCNSPTETKIPMVLRKAQMEFKGDKLNYCGSLGNHSYFDHQCMAATQQSSATFTPSSGLLLISGAEFQCKAL